MMTALSYHEHCQHSSPPIGEMRCMFDAGYSLLPLGGGDDGKSPLVRFEGSKRFPFGTVVNRMNAKGSSVYGVRLSGILVVDVDTDTPEAERYVRERFPSTPYTVATPRGRHYWFRHNGPAPKRVRQPGIVIDFKAGAGSYVAGPGSIRPDGGSYVCEGKYLGSLAELPAFADGEDVGKPPFLSGALVLKGERTFTLWEKSREFVECVDSLDELAAELRSYADWHFEDAINFSDAEISKSAKWAWEKRLQNQLWGGEISAVIVHWHEVQALMQHRNGPDAQMLLTMLRHNHVGDKRFGKPFMIAARKMAEADVIPGWSADRYYRAKDTLQKIGLITPIKRGNSHAGASLYVFRRLASDSTNTEGGGFPITYVANMRHGEDA